MVIDSTGLITWIPLEGVTTSGEVTLTVTDDDSPAMSAIEVFVITVTPVNDAPVITSTAPNSAIEDSLYTYQPTAEDPENGTLTWSLITAPVGMTIDSSTGTVTWTPAEADTSSGQVTLTVTDDGTPQLSASEVFTIAVTETNDAPVITSTAPTSATEDSLYTYAPAADDPENGVLTWTLANEPAGMVIDSTGLITWIPLEGVTTSGEVTLTVTDDGSPALSAIEVFTITVTPVNDPPTITSNAPASATGGSLYTYAATAEDPENGILTWSLSNAPAGMTVESSSGTVNWTPFEGDTSSGEVTLTVTDDGIPSMSASEVFTVSVISAVNEPLLTTAFAFGADNYTVGTANETTVQYTKINQNASYIYDSSGYGYTDYEDLDKSPNNRGRISCELYDQFIGVKNGFSITFRADVPNGEYRFVGAGGDAQYGGHYTRIVVRDFGGGDSVVLVEGTTLGPKEYWTSGFGAFQPPQCSEAVFVAQPESPVLTVTGGAVEIVQYSGGGNGGDLSLIEIWQIDNVEIVNNPPIVNAGASLNASTEEAANLNGSVSDDGKPFGVLNVLWSQVSGPGVVSFADSSNAATTAAFSKAGLYTLCLSADDGEFADSDYVNVTIEDAADEVHPRLFVKANRVPELQTAVSGGSTHHVEAFEALIARVDQNDWTMYDENLEDNNWNYARSWLAREAALAYLITEDTRYVTIAYDALESIYSDPDPDNLLPDTGDGLSRAMLGMGFALVYDWCYDDLTQAQRDFVFEKIISSLDAWPSYEYVNLGAPYVSNWVAVCRSAEMVLMLSAYEEANRAARFDSLTLFLDSHIVNAYGSGGMTQEGLAHCLYGGQFLIPAVYACADAGYGDLDSSFSSRPFWKLAMYGMSYTPEKDILQSGVDPASANGQGWPSLLLNAVPVDSLAHYRHFYDRLEGTASPALTGSKYDFRRAGTVWSILYYPEQVSSIDPTGAFGVLHPDPDRGAFLFREKWEDSSDAMVSIVANENNAPYAWNSNEAFQINLIVHNTRFIGGPCKTTSSEVYSTLLVDGSHSAEGVDSGYTEFFAQETNGGYVVINGGSQYQNLGIMSAKRHLKVDFSSGPGEPIISTLDKLRDESVHEYAWQINVGDELDDGAIIMSSGDEDGRPYFLLTAPNGSYTKGWILHPSDAVVLSSDPLQVKTTSDDADIWIVMKSGTGTPTVGTVQGTGLSTVLTIDGKEVSYNETTDRIKIVDAQ